MVDGDPGALGEYVINCQEGDIDSDPAIIQSLEMGVHHVKDLRETLKPVSPCC